MKLIEDIFVAAVMGGLFLFTGYCMIENALNSKWAVY